MTHPCVWHITHIHIFVYIRMNSYIFVYLIYTSLNFYIFVYTRVFYIYIHEQCSKNCLLWRTHMWHGWHYIPTKMRNYRGIFFFNIYEEVSNFGSSWRTHTWHCWHHIVNITFQQKRLLSITTKSQGPVYVTRRIRTWHDALVTRMWNYLFVCDMTQSRGHDRVSATTWHHTAPHCTTLQ